MTLHWRQAASVCETMRRTCGVLVHWLGGCGTAAGCWGCRLPRVSGGLRVPCWRSQPCAAIRARRQRLPLPCGMLPFVQLVLLRACYIALLLSPSWLLLRLLLLPLLVLPLLVLLRLVLLLLLLLLLVLLLLALLRLVLLVWLWFPPCLLLALLAALCLTGSLLP